MGGGRLSVPGVGSLVITALAFGLGAPVLGGELPAGWTRHEHGVDGYSLRFVPPDLVGQSNLPLVLFLHGSNGVPDNYVTFLDGPAEVAGVVLVAPAATHSIGWVPGLDEPTVDAALAAVQTELSIDPRRVAYAGHSSGGAYAIQLAYLAKRNVSAVFSIAAPFRTIGAIVDSANPAPLRMAYGTLDPNYATALPPYEAQWQALGLAYELDIRPGVGHNSLGTATMNSAFQFLAAQTYGGSLCATLGPAVCLLGERYRVEVGWRIGTGATGVATAQATSNDSVLLSFFAPDNWEMLVKVLDGCAVNGHRWVFASAATDVEWTLTVTDSHTGAVASWTNPLGTRSAALTAVDAFACDE